jgi:hypothetical protein
MTMRVLFLYYHFPQAEPLLRIREQLATHDVLLDARQIESPEVLSQTIPRHVVPSIAEHIAEKTFDLLVLQHQIMQEEALFCRRPVVILERIDGAQLESRHWLPNVAGLIKNYAMRPRSLYNEHSGRRSARLLHDAGILVENTRVVDGRPPQLSEAELEKIVVGYGFGSYPRFDLAMAQFTDMESARPFAAQLRCQHGYKGTEMGEARGIAARTMVNIAEAMPGRILTGTEIPYEDYLREMTRGRGVVSPWGWGEACHRDYEASLLGAVLIKPDSDYVDGWPDIYRAGETYLPCAVDYSDLEQTILRVDEAWPSFMDMRMRARELTQGAMSPGMLASRMVSLFRRFA